MSCIVIARLLPHFEFLVEIVAYAQSVNMHEINYAHDISSQSPTDLSHSINLELELERPPLLMLRTLA